MVLLTHPPRNGVLPTPPLPRKRAHPPPSTVTQALAALHGHPRTTRMVALLPRGAVSGAVPREFDGLVARGVEAHFAFGAVGYADASLDDAVGTVGVRALSADATVLGGGWTDCTERTSVGGFASKKDMANLVGHRGDTFPKYKFATKPVNFIKKNYTATTFSVGKKRFSSG
eukprot:scaffold1539_cov191-Alexandrium_tamarense.AAC.21